MSDEIQFDRICSPQDDRNLGEIFVQAFNTSPKEEQIYRDRLGAESFRLLRRDREILGGLGIYDMGQWWGERAVPMAGLSAVAIAPEHRGMGRARELLERTLHELYERDYPISTLYPATQRLYRQIGYERAGSYCQWEVPLASLWGGDRPLSVHSVSPESEILRDLYRQQARRQNGNLDRHPAIWQAIFDAENAAVYAYLFGSVAQPEGYIIYTQAKEGDTSHLCLRDWVGTTPAALRGLSTFLADHRSQIETARWRGSIRDPLGFLLPEQTARIRSLQWWMLRVVRVDLALAQRGYPLGVKAELHLSVRDELLDGNNGSYILSVADGIGEVRRGGRGDLQLDAKGMAALYSGLYGPRQLQQMGSIDGNNRGLAAASSIFAGLEPFSMDFF